MLSAERCPEGVGQPGVSTSAQTWRMLRDGNARFAAGYGAQRARTLALESEILPTAVVFDCSDSIAAAGKVFDQGVGAVFTVSTFGHVIGPGVLGSIEYAVAELGVPLVVVLGHQECGAVRAAADSGGDRRFPDGYARALIDQVEHSLGVPRDIGMVDGESLQARHLAAAGTTLMARSAILAARVREGQCVIAWAICGQDGRVCLKGAIGDVGEAAPLSGG